jgi:serine/threonine-protein kinase
MGAVYVASHVRIPRQFAVKVLPAGLAAEPEVQARFEREAMVGSRLGHDHIVQVVDFNRSDGGEPYIVMELLSGRDLAALVAAEGPLPLERAVRIIRQTAIAIADAHEAGVIHRDLKPENIFICPSAELGDLVKVLDFGLSKVLTSQTRLTQASQIFGTPWFMSPEQAQGHIDAIDHRSDLFALGLVFYYVLTAMVPFPGPDIVGVLYQVVHEEPRPMAELRPELPPLATEIVSRATQKNPAERYPSARELIDDLDRLVPRIGASSRGVSARSIGESPARISEVPTALNTGPALPVGPTLTNGGNAAPKTQPPLAFVATAAVESERQSTLGTSVGERRTAQIPSKRGLGIVVGIVASAAVAAVAAVAIIVARSDQVPASTGARPATIPDARRPALERGPEETVVRPSGITTRATKKAARDAGLRPDRGLADLPRPDAGTSAAVRPRPKGVAKPQIKKKAPRLGEGVVEDE